MKPTQRKIIMPLDNHLLLVNINKRPIVGILKISSPETPDGKTLIPFIWEYLRNEPEINGPIGVLDSSDDIKQNFGDFVAFTKCPPFIQWRNQVDPKEEMNVLTLTRAFIFSNGLIKDKNILNSILGIEQNGYAAPTITAIQKIQSIIQQHKNQNKEIPAQQWIYLSEAYEQYASSIVRGRKNLAHIIANK